MLERHFSLASYKVNQNNYVRGNLTCNTPPFCDQTGESQPPLAPFVVKAFTGCFRCSLECHWKEPYNEIKGKPNQSPPVAEQPSCLCQLLTNASRNSLSSLSSLHTATVDHTQRARDSKQKNKKHQQPRVYNKREECRTPNVTNGKCKRKVT